MSIPQSALTGIRLLIFDLDGTLVDSKKDLAQSVNAMRERLGIARYFSFIYGGNSFEQKKPAPVGVKKLMRDMGATSDQTLIVGDSDTDVLTGRNAGIWTCGVTYGFGAHTLESAPPDIQLGDLRDLPALLNGKKRFSPDKR